MRFINKEYLNRLQRTILNMKTEEIIEGNKLIAEFMGYHIITPQMRKSSNYDRKSILHILVYQ